MTGAEFWPCIEAKGRRRSAEYDAGRDLLFSGLACMMCDLIALQMLFHFDAKGRRAWIEGVQPEPVDVFARWTGRHDGEAGHSRDRVVEALNEMPIFDAALTDA